MELDELFKQLEEKEKEYKIIEQKMDAVIEKEIVAIREIEKKIKLFVPRKEINGDTTMLLYVYPEPKPEEEKKTYIDSNVYLLEERDEVVYKILNYDMYVQIQPDVEIKGGYAYKPLKDFLIKKPLAKIVEYYERRVKFLGEVKTPTLVEEMITREEALNVFNQLNK